MAFKLELLSDVSSLLRGTADVEGALEDVAGSLDDVAADAERAAKAFKAQEAIRELRELEDAARDAGSDMETVFREAANEVERELRDFERDASRHLDGTADEAEDSGERMERTFREAFDTAKRESKQAGDEVGRNTKRGMDDAEDATRTFKDEARQNLSESVSSFRGDIEDIPQLFQDVFGGVVGDLGPAGMIGGLFAAAGIGMGVAYLQGAAEKADELKQKTIDLARQMQEAGGELDKMDLGSVFDDWSYAIADAKEWWEIWQKAPITNIEQAADAARELGVSTGILSDALSGVDPQQTLDSLGLVNDRLTELDDQMADIIEREGLWGASQDDTWRSLRDEHEELVHLRNRLEETNEQTQDAIRLEELVSGARDESVVAAQDAAEAEAALRDEREQAREGARSLMEAELGYAEQLDKTNETLAENGANTDISTEAGRANRQALLDQADASRDLIQATLDQGASTDEATALLEQHRQALIDAATQAGYSEQAARDYADQLLGTPENITTDFEVTGTTQAQRDIEAVTDRDYGTVRVPVSPDASLFQQEMQGAVDRAAARIRRPEVMVNFKVGMKAV